MNYLAERMLPEARETWVAGVDEAGRGPLAGPVAAAAVILRASAPITGLRDSKLLTATRRELLAAEIRAVALAWAVGWAEVVEIDRMNILQASLLAMQRAVLALSVPPDQVLVDGNVCPRLPCLASAVVQGDRSVAAISAASILAKVERDALMRRLDADFRHTDCHPQGLSDAAASSGARHSRTLLQPSALIRAGKASYGALR